MSETNIKAGFVSTEPVKAASCLSGPLSRRRASLGVCAARWCSRIFEVYPCPRMDSLTGRGLGWLLSATMYLCIFGSRAAVSIFLVSLKYFHLKVTTSQKELPEGSWLSSLKEVEYSSMCLKGYFTPPARPSSSHLCNTS